MKTVCIDPGHGDHELGAVGPSGLEEKEVTLDVGLLLAKELESDFEVGMTRTEDVFVSLAERAAFANRMQADLFISIHCNSGPPGKGTGFEVYTTPGETASDRAATETFLSYAAEFTDLRKRVDMADGDPDKEAGFAVLRMTRCPAILFELEFIHTFEGEEWLMNRGHQLRAAQALGRGVRKFFGVVDGGADKPDESGAPIVGEAISGVEMVSMPVTEYRALLDGMLEQAAGLVTLHNRGLELLES